MYEEALAVREPGVPYPTRTYAIHNSNFLFGEIFGFPPLALRVQLPINLLKRAQALLTAEAAREVYTQYPEKRAPA
jgi:hypothetical protein